MGSPKGEAWLGRWAEHTGRALRVFVSMVLPPGREIPPRLVATLRRADRLCRLGVRFFHLGHKVIAPGTTLPRRPQAAFHFSAARFFPRRAVRPGCLFRSWLCSSLGFRAAGRPPALRRLAPGQGPCHFPAWAKPAAAVPATLNPFLRARLHSLSHPMGKERE